MRQIKEWVQQGNPNCHHMLMLLQALRKATKPAVNPKEVRRAYDEAIIAAGRLGFLHHQALANRLAGSFFLQSK